MSDYREFHPDEPSRIAVEAIEEREQKAHKDESIVTTSVGVVFKTKPVALGLLQDIQKKYGLCVRIKIDVIVLFLRVIKNIEPAVGADILRHTIEVITPSITNHR